MSLVFCYSLRAPIVASTTALLLLVSQWLSGESGISEDKSRRNAAHESAVAKISKEYDE